MAYKKVYFDDVWSVTSTSGRKCADWMEDISEIAKPLETLSQEESFKGAGAQNIKSYISEIHGFLNGLILELLANYNMLTADYYKGYLDNVDSAGRYTTIVFDEVNSNGSIPRKLKSLQSAAQFVTNDANNVKYSISHLMNVYNKPKFDELNTAIQNAINAAIKINSKVITYEESRKNDFSAFDNLVKEVNKILDNQLGNSRIPVVSYQSGYIGLLCDFKSIQVSVSEIEQYINDFMASDSFEEAINLRDNRDAIIQAEEEKKREWAKWVAVGIAVVGSVVLIAVTAGGATPVACAITGGIVGAATAASSCFADNYVKNGSWTKNMNWSDFTEKTLIGGVTGAISGAFGAVSTGSAIKQPIQGAFISASQGIVEEVAENVIEIGFDVGEAFVSGKPGDEIVGVFHDGANDLFKDVTSVGIGDFVEGYFETKFGINTGDKNYLTRVGESVVTGATGELSEGIVGGIWDVGTAFVNGGNVRDVACENAKETANNLFGSFGKSIVGEIVDDDRLKDSNLFKKTVVKGAQGAVSSAAEDVVGGVAERTVDYIDKVSSGKEADIGDILDGKTIWDEDLQHGRNAVQDAAENIGKTIADDATKDNKITNDMKKIDYDSDGKVEIVDFGTCKVTKLDYDAAVEVAGKGAYKGKTVEEILDLPKNTNLDDAKFRNVSYDRIVKDPTYEGESKAPHIKVVNKKSQ